MDKPRKTSTEAVRKFREKKRELFGKMQDAIAQINWSRRLNSLKSPRAWIETYCVGDDGFLNYSPFTRTDEIISAMWTAADARVPYHIRMTRSGGKTSLMMCLIAERILTARSMFCVFTASKATPQATDMIDDLWTFLESNDRVVQDFPEVCLPIVELDGSSQKARTQKYYGKRTAIRKAKNNITLPTIDIPRPPCAMTNPMCSRIIRIAIDNLCGKPSGGILLANGFDAKIRGLRKGNRRPDLILLDDLQDDDMAASAEQVEKARKKIYKSYFKLGSQKQKPSILMTSTPICPDDLSEVFARDKNWRTQTFRMMESMPSESALELWARYKDIRDTAETGKHPETEFYLANRSAMDDGARPFWLENFSDADGEISAIQHAMNAYLDDPESFESEYQMQPRRAASVYEITAKAVATATNNVPMGIVPRQCDRVIAAIDVMNNAGLRYALVAFGANRVSAVIGYGRYPADGKPLYPHTATIDEKDQAVASAMTILLRQFRVARYRYEGGGSLAISAVGIDAGWQSRVVHTAARRFSADWAMLLKGASWQNFSPRAKSGRLRGNVLQVGEWCYTAEGQWGTDLIFHSDYWMETAQRAWLVPPLQVGSLSVFKAREDEHIQFANECVADRLVNKTKLADGSSEVWQWAANGANHLGDCVKMALALAYWKRAYCTASETMEQELLTSASPARKKARRKITKCI